MSNRAESHWQLRRDRLLARPFVHAVQSSRVPIILTDPHEGDHPIVFCNEAFLALTGYGESEVLGRNCRFLQGERTSAEAVAAVRGAIGREEPVSVELLNYRKSGEPFWNELHVAPVYGPGDGRAIYFIGSQIDVTRRRRTQRELEEANRSLEARVEERTRQLRKAMDDQALLMREVNHRVKNSLQLIRSLLALQANNIADPRARAEIRQASDRINAVMAIHARMYQAVDPETVDLLSTVRLLCDDLNDSVAVNGAADRIRVSGEPVAVPAERVIPLSLVVTELVTNALKYAYAPGEAGAVEVEVRRGRSGALRLSVTDGGRGLPQDFDPARNGGLGMRVIAGNLENLAGTMRVERRARGVAFHIEVPVAG